MSYQTGLIRPGGTNIRCKVKHGRHTRTFIRLDGAQLFAQWLVEDGEEPSITKIDLTPSGAPPELVALADPFPNAKKVP